MNSTKEEFDECASEIFENNPEIKSFSWNQYTQYDGDDTFNINNIEVIPDTKKCSDIVSDFISGFDNYFYIRIFGDHAKISINKYGVSVTEFDEHE